MGVVDFQASLQTLLLFQQARQRQYKAFIIAADSKYYLNQMEFGSLISSGRY